MNPFKTLTQMVKYHRSIDVEKALRWQYSIGYKAGQRDAMKHMPWPSEPHTDPLQEVTPLPPVPQQSVLSMQTGQFARLVRKQEGRTIHTQIMKAIGQVQLAELQARMREKEGQP